MKITFVQCDRCGRNITDWPTELDVTSALAADERFDLCRDCTDLFKAWLQSSPTRGRDTAEVWYDKFSPTVNERSG